MRICRAIISTVTALSISMAASAGNYFFHAFQSEDGLPNSCITCGLQDRLGFIWLGTKDGISRYDGTRFRLFDSPGTESPVSGLTTTICEDNEGCIWFASNNGIGYYDPMTDKVSVIDITEGSLVRDIEVDTEGSIWIATTGSMYRYSKSKGLIKEYTKDQYFPAAYMCKDPVGSIWFSSGDGNLYSYSSLSDNFIHITVLSATEKEKGVSLGELTMADDERLLVTTSDHKLKRVNIRSSHVETVFNIKEHGEDAVIRCAYANGPDEYWIGTERGLYITDSRSLKVKECLKASNETGSISGDNIRCIFGDRENNVWAGTFFSGLNLWQNGKSNFCRFYSERHNDSFKGKVARATCVDNEGNVWVGTEEGQLNRIDHSTGEVRNVSSEWGLSGISSYHSLLPSGDLMWAGSFGAGVFLLDIEGHSIRKHYDLPCNNVEIMFRSSDNRIVAGTERGIYLYDPSSDSFNFVNAFGELYVHTMFQDSKGFIWVGTYGQGIRVWNVRTREVSAIEKGDNGLLSGCITAFYEDYTGKLWIGTEGAGLCRVDERDDENGIFSLTYITRNDGLPTNIVCGIAEDRKHNLWIATSNGLEVIDPVDLSHKARLVEDQESIGNNFTYGSLLSTRSGLFYAGTTKGLLSFNPEVDFSAMASDLFITDISIVNERGGKSIAEEGLSTIMTERVVLKRKDAQAMSIRFSCPYYDKPESFFYDYSLSRGRRQIIKSVTNSGEATFSIPKSGKYRFVVSLVGSEGPDTRKELKIVIRPPFYDSIIAWMLYICLVLAGAVLAENRVRERKNKESLIRIDMLEKEKQNEIFDAKIKFFTNITHEIRTPLTLIKMPVEKMIRDHGYKDSSREDMMAIQSNTNRLLELINQLLDIRKMEQQQTVKNFLDEDITAIVLKTCDYFTNVAKERHIDFNIDVPDEHISAMCMGDSIQKIITNLLSNAVKYGKDMIHIKLEEKDDNVVISVASNGELISENDREQIFAPFYQIVSATSTQLEGSKGTGLGLPFARTLAELHNGKLYVDPTDDLFNTFILEFPKNQEQSISIEGDNGSTIEENTADFDGSKHTILIVEDSTDMKIYISRELSDEYNTILASNGEEAIRIIGEQKVDLVISDIMMPVMGGYELCNALKGNVDTCHIPVILLTAAVGLEAHMETLRAGADGYIEKPFSVDLLKANITNIFKNKDIAYKQFTSSPLTHYNSATVNHVDEEFMNRLHNEVMSHLSEQDLNIESLTTILGTSKSTLYRKIKANTGLNINEYIRLCRLKQAAEMLSSQKYRINEVAYLVGFSSPSYFTTSFQKQFNISPSAFVKQLKEDE